MDLVRDRDADKSARPLGYVAYGLIADVALVVRIDDVERGGPPLAHGGFELLPVACGVQRVDRHAAGELRIIDRPAQCDGA